MIHKIILLSLIGYLGIELAYAQDSTNIEDDLVTNWVKENSNSFSLSNADPKQFDFLDSIAQNSEVIAIGDVSHGIRESLETKIEIFKYLALYKGFTVFAIEDDYVSTLKLNNYLMYGKGAPGKLLKEGYYMMHSNQTMLGLVNWMREYNKKISDETKMLKIYGYDFQKTSNVVNEIKSHLDTGSSAYKFLDTLRLKKHVRWGMPTLTDNQFDAVVQLMKSTPQLEADTARLGFLLKLLLYSQETTHADNAGVTRDGNMGSLIYLIQQRNHCKILVSGINEHISYGYMTLVKTQKEYPFMGEVLKEKYGDDFKTIAFQFNEGSFKANTIDDNKAVTTTFTLPMAPNKSLPYVFSKTGFESFYLDFGKLKEHPEVLNWFKKNQSIRFISAVFRKEWGNYEAMRGVSMKDSFDGIIFFDKVSAYELLKD